VSNGANRIRLDLLLLVTIRLFYDERCDESKHRKATLPVVREAVHTEGRRPPRSICGQACRQRAYEARKRAHTHSDATAHDNPAPRIAPLVITSREKPFFTPEDAEEVFKRIGPRERIDFGSVAGTLDLIADNCVHASRRGTAPTAGEHQKWFQLVGCVARKLLVHFGVSGPLDHLDGNRTAGAVNALLRAVPPNVSLDFYLRDMMAKEIKAPTTPSEWHTIRACLRGLQFLTHRTDLAADAMEKDKGASRTAPREEINLVAQLHPLYVEVTGDEGWYTTNLENETQSAFVSLVSAVAAHIHNRLEIVDPPAPARLANGLKALSTSPRRIIKRIQQVRKLP
jgi:hypothetical protein